MVKTGDMSLRRKEEKQGTLAVRNEAVFSCDQSDL